MEVWVGGRGEDRRTEGEEQGDNYDSYSVNGVGCCIRVSSQQRTLGNSMFGAQIEPFLRLGGAADTGRGRAWRGGYLCCLLGSFEQ